MLRSGTAIATVDAWIEEAIRRGVCPSCNGSGRTPYGEPYAPEGYHTECDACDGSGKQSFQQLYDEVRPGLMAELRRLEDTIEDQDT